MGQSDKPNDGPLNAIIRVAAEMMKEYKQHSDQIKKAMEIALADAVQQQQQPVDCVALLDLIQAAQSLYAEKCPIA